jgi:hypothetical protein
VGDVWFVKMQGRIVGSAWFACEMEVEIKFVVAHDKINGQFE